MDHRPSRNPWQLSLLLLVVAAVVLVLSCAVVHGTKDCNKEIGTNEENDDGGKGGDCHGRNHTHSHGHHGDGDGGGGGGKGKDKDKPGTPPPAGFNPWILSAGAAPRPQLVSGFTEATGVVILVTAAAVWSLATYIS